MSYAELLNPFLSGFAFYALLYGWRRASLYWQGWFPLVRRVAELTMLLMTVASAGYALILIAGAPTPLPVIAAVGLGLLSFPALKTLLSPDKTGERLERGASVASPAEVTRAVKKAGGLGEISIGGVPVPKRAEPYHFMIAGSTGSGKSVAINTMLDSIRARGDTAIIVDSGGEFLKRFWNPETDHILNPFDKRCVPWSPTAELDGPWDAESLSRSIIPDGVGETKEWNGYAQAFLTSCIQNLWKRNCFSLSDLLWAVQAASTKELGPLLEGTAAAGQLASEKTFGSIRTIASKYTAPYAYLRNDDKPFSVSKFIKSEKKGFLYLTYRDDQLDSLRNLISCVLDIAARTTLSLPADPNRRIWLIIDEFASIGKVQSIEAIATKARKMGGCLLLGVQSISQLNDRYGEHGAQTILSCLSSWLVLRCADPDTAEYMSRYLGEQQVVRTSEGSSESEATATKNWSEQSMTKRVVMATELTMLGDLKGYLKLAGAYPVCGVALPFPKKKDSASDTFVPRDFTTAPLLELKASESLRGQIPGAPQQPKRAAEAPAAKAQASAGENKPMPAPEVAEPPADNPFKARATRQAAPVPPGADMAQFLKAMESIDFSIFTAPPQATATTPSVAETPAIAEPPKAAPLELVQDPPKSPPPARTPAAKETRDPSLAAPAVKNNPEPRKKPQDKKPEMPAIEFVAPASAPASVPTPASAQATTSGPVAATQRLVAPVAPKQPPQAAAAPSLTVKTAEPGNHPASAPTTPASADAEFRLTAVARIPRKPQKPAEAGAALDGIR